MADTCAARFSAGHCELDVNHPGPHQFTTSEGEVHWTTLWLVRGQSALTARYFLTERERERGRWVRVVSVRRSQAIAQLREAMRAVGV